MGDDVLDTGGEDVGGDDVGAEDVGGDNARTMSLRLDNGVVTVKSQGKEKQL